MNIPRAIEILNRHAIVLKDLDDHDYFDSICLGIQAMNCIDKARDGGFIPANFLLPGETEAYEGG